MPTILVAVSLIKSEGRYTLVQEAQKKFRGKWGFAGGEKKPGESIFECAVREDEEETGHTCKLLDVVGFYQQECRNKTIWGVAFRARIVGGKMKLTKEILEIGQFSVPEVREMDKNGLLRS